MASPYRVVCFRPPTYTCLDNSPQFFDPCSTDDDDDFYPTEMYCTTMLPPQCIQPRQQIGEVVRYCGEFCVKVDVKHFKPDEIQVKTVDNRVVIHAKHEDREDEQGFISREFTRQYVLPEDVDPRTVTSCICSDGILIIKAPRMSADAPRERTVPVEYTNGSNGSSGSNGSPSNNGSNGSNGSPGNNGGPESKGSQGATPAVSTSQQRNS